MSQTNHNESYLFVTPDNSPQQTVDLVESTAFFQENLVHNMKGQICVAWQLLIESKWWEWDVFVYIHATKLKKISKFTNSIFNLRINRNIMHENFWSTSSSQSRY